MQIDLTRYDHVDDPPSLRITYHARDNCFYVHRDYSGPMQTLVRVCLLRLTGQDMAMSNMARRCLEELQSIGRSAGNGVITLRHNDNARVLLARIQQELERPDSPPMFPSPTNPTLPDMGEHAEPICYGGEGTG